MKKKKTTKGTKRTIAIYILIVIAFYIAIYVVPQVSDIFVETYHAEYGTFEESEEAECLFVRDEKLYHAQSSGVVERVISRGKLMRIRSHIVDVGQIAYYSDMRGMVSYFYDELEEVYRPENIDEMSYGTLEQIRNDEEHQVRKASDEEAASGEPIFKIVDNQKWYLVFWVNSDTLNRYEEGKQVIVDFLDGSEKRESTQIQMKIESLTAQGEQTRILLSCNSYYKDFDRYRIKTCKLITAQTRGIFLETDSIVEEDGQKGVYVVDKFGNYNFTPIRILNQEGELTVAEKNYYYDEEGNSVETVSNYDEILRPEVEKEKSEDDEDDKTSKDKKE
ncbi:MAG: hypothetical protein HFE73_06415 [Firmicutes bacterium]|nr:hypothetical protein [Bacillota bacterium]